MEAGAPVPVGLYSHSDQIQHWQTATPDLRSAEGWGGRLADLMSNVNADNGLSMNISLAGSNLYQTGDTSFAYAIDADGSKKLSGSAAPFLSPLNRRWQFGGLAAILDIAAARS